MADNPLPRLRPVDPHPIAHEGQRAILLRDPLQLCDQTVIIPGPLAPMLMLCDGTRDVEGLRAALQAEWNLGVEPDVLEMIVAALDKACLLENERSGQAQAQALAAYRQAPSRPPILAGQSYPDDPGALRLVLDRYLGAAECEPASAAEGRGLVCPHIDYPRGGPTYARVWKRAADVARAAEVVVLLGTDHFGGDGLLKLTRQHYRTPFGILPTAQTIVDGLAQAMGQDASLPGELYHRTEHAIELAAVWLHHARDGQPCETVPILCGSFGSFVRGEAAPEDDPAIDALVDALGPTLSERRTIVVAAADLSHVGPAFGGEPLDRAARARLQAADDEIIAHVCAGDAQAVFESIKRQGDRHNVCGLPPIYVALRLLNPSRGDRVAYDLCPADQNGTSVVSVCGVILE